MTAKNRYIFRPLEKLSVQTLGSIAIEEVAVDDRLDIEFKPGLYQQTRAFLDADARILPTLDDQLSVVKFFDQIEGLRA